VGHDRSVRVIEDDALFVIKPTWGFIDLGNDRADPEHGDPVAQNAFGLVKGLSLPSEYIDEFRNFRTEICAWSNNRGPFRGAIRDIACGTAGKKVIKIGIRHCQQLRHIIAHGFRAP
jgi:hypothetical protein